jgi:hypothetical protein
MSLRLRASRREKLSTSAKALQALQDELQEEDDKFKEAVQAAEDSAVLAEVCNVPVLLSRNAPNKLYHFLTLCNFC